MDALKKVDADMKIEGKVECSMENGKISIRGKKLSIFFSDESDAFRMVGDEGIIEVLINKEGDDIDDLDLIFTGNATCQLGEARAKADKIAILQKNETEIMELTGSASAILPDAELSAEFIKMGIDGESITLLEGDAKIRKHNGKDAATSIHAEKIKWNALTDEITAANATTVSTGKKK